MVSVIFINHRSTELLAQALKSLVESEQELDKEVIVVDNASGENEGIVELCRCYNARLIRLRRNIGYGAAANLGFCYAQEKYIAVSNPDVEFLPKTVTRLLDFLENTPEAGVVSPQLLYPNGEPQPSCRRLPKLRYVVAGRRSFLRRLFPAYPPAREFLYLGVEERKEPVEVEAVIGTFMVFRRQAFTEVGGFDERYFMFAEDLDICQRLTQKGWRVFLLPQVRIYHHYGGVRRKRRRFTEYHRIKSLYRFFTKGKGAIGSLFLAVAFAGYFFALEALGVLGLGEFEYSWQGRIVKDKFGDKIK